MKQYKVTLKGTKKNQTETIEVLILSDNKAQAFNWAWWFFERGEYKEPYANHKGEMVSTDTFIPNAKAMQIFKGRYRVSKAAIKPA